MRSWTGSAGVYRWEFDKGDESLTVAVDGPLNVDDIEIVIRAAIDGVGLALTLEEPAAISETRCSTASVDRRTPFHRPHPTGHRGSRSAALLGAGVLDRRLRR
jgi:hypothetical protein